MKNVPKAGMERIGRDGDDQNSTIVIGAESMDTT